MGITDSKILAQKVLTACAEAETQGSSRLDSGSFWRDEVVSNAAKKVFQQVPRHIRGNCRQNAAERAAARSNSKILVPEVVRDLQNKQRKTLEQNGSSRDTSLSDQSMQDCALAGCYVFVNDIEKNKEFSTIRLRIFYILFFRLKQSIQPKRLCADVINLLVGIIYHSGLVEDSKDVVERKLVTWIDRGERYELLAKDLGGLGSLLVLPDDIPESVWTKDLPKTAGHERRLAVINSMKRRGITEAAAGLNPAAEAELEKLWNPIWISVDMEIDQELSRMRNPGDEGATTRTGSYQGSTSSPYVQYEQPDTPVPYRNSEVQNIYTNNPQALGSGITYGSKNCQPHSMTMGSRNVQAIPSEVPYDALSISKGAVHDLASFSMLPGPSAEDMFPSLPANVYHDLASFSMLPDPASEDVFPSLPSNFHHDLGSFSMLPNPASEDGFTSLPSNVYHNLASFSLLPNAPFDDAVSAVPSTVHHGPTPFSMHSNCTTRGAMLSSDTNVAHISDHPTFPGTCGPALSSISISSVAENDHQTPISAHA